jgi:hypothetical protein
MADGQPIVIGQNNSGQSQTLLQTNASGANSALKVLNALGVPAPNAIFGECQEGVGVRGMTGVNLPFTPSVTQAGVLGTGIDRVGVAGVSASAAGVRGDADEGVGVQGSSRTSQGMEGRSTDGIGVEGHSSQGIGVHGLSDGTFTGPPTSASAVSGENMVGSGNGVTGLSGGRNGVEGRSFSSAASGVYGQNDVGGFGVAGRANGDQPALLGENSGTGNGLTASSQQANGAQGISGSHNASGVYGENNAGGYGVAGRTFGLLNEDRAAVLGESLRDPSTPAGSPNGKAAGVYGYSETGYGGVFITGQAGSDVPWANSGGLRVVGEIVKTEGEYSEALPHPDGSHRLLYAPLSPESWYEDYGRAQLVEGQADVELDADLVAVLGIEDGDYHVFLTPEGDTRGLYVESRSAGSFRVREQQAGTSNATFSYRVAAKNQHRQPKRLARLEEPKALTRFQTGRDDASPSAPGRRA